jgi:dynein assembly factor 6, axonemal
LLVTCAGGGDPNAIWAPDELQDAIEDDLEDGRPAPKYDFVYKQAVQTTDTFLGMDPMGKDPTSTSCEDLVLNVTLPEASSAADVDVDLKPTWIIVRTGVHKLSTYLPRKVNEDQSRAEWNSKERKLKITMRIVREDF